MDITRKAPHKTPDDTLFNSSISEIRIAAAARKNSDKNPMSAGDCVNPWKAEATARNHLPDSSPRAWVS